MAFVRIYFARNFRAQYFHSAIFRRIAPHLSHPVYQRCKMLTGYKYRHAHVLSSVVGMQHHSAHSKRVVCTCVAFVSPGSGSNALCKTFFFAALSFSEHSSRSSSHNSDSQFYSFSFYFQFQIKLVGAAKSCFACTN